MSPPDASEITVSRPRGPALRRWSVIGGLVVVLLAGGWVVYWHQAAGIVEARTAEWFAARRADGWEARHEGLAVSGFPFHFVLDISAPVLAEPGRWRWQGPQMVRGTALAVAFGTWHVSAPGDHHVLLDGRTWRADVPLSLGRLEADIAFDGGRFDSVEGAGGDAVLHLPDGRPVTLDGFDVRVAEPAAAGETPEAVLDLMLDVRGLHLPHGTLAPFEDDVPNAGLTAVLRAPFGTEGELAERLAAWRDRGGVLDITRLAGRVEPVSADADGTVTLDQALQPIGAFTVVARGAGEAVDRFSRAGMVDDGAAMAAKLALGVMGGARGEVRTSLTVQDRTLYIGKLPVARLPRVSW